MTPDASTVILLVEHDDRLRQLVMQRLERKQYWVVCARNGEEAWDLFSAHRPLMSLLITEVVLPDMDGLELASRARDLTPDLPVLYMAEEDEVSAAVRQGVASTNNFYLMKPFDHDYLLLKGGGRVAGLRGSPVWNWMGCLRSRAGGASALSVDDSRLPHGSGRDRSPAGCRP